MYGTVYGSDTGHVVATELLRQRWVNLAEAAEPLSFARAQVRQTLDGRASASAVDDAVLVASELVGNALRHTAVGPDCMNVEVYLGIAVLWVHDAGTDTECVRPTEKTSNDDLLESGRGLHLVDRLTAKWFVKPTAIGKAVVAVVALDDRGVM
ncbi:ATP-binding protein [Streptomyces sp. NPDC058614]|uniref:ATP-binding protein n=1 Tax=Streptomyces sp. NPDC058614 TaxID=3346557 RepID=UPI0036569521